jgi:hypothetical protein
MARLFVTPRELNYISDLTKELIKDVVGQRVYLFPISELKTQTHGVYNESLQKVYDNPIALDALVDSNFQTDTKIDKFGVDAQFKVEVFVQYRDLVDKGINVNIGDFFSFSDVFYEITERVFMRNIYGLPEHKDGVKFIGIKAREGLFKAPTVGPTDIARPEPDAVQTEFHQQRGSSVDQNGDPTGDKRDLVDKGVLDSPLTGPKQISSKGDPDGVGSSFYDE